MRENILVKIINKKNYINRVMTLTVYKASNGDRI